MKTISSKILKQLYLEEWSQTTQPSSEQTTTQCSAPNSSPCKPTTASKAAQAEIHSLKTCHKSSHPPHTSEWSLNAKTSFLRLQTHRSHQFLPSLHHQPWDREQTCHPMQTHSYLEDQRAQLSFQPLNLPLWASQGNSTQQEPPLLTRSHPLWRSCKMGRWFRWPRPKSISVKCARTGQKSASADTVSSASTLTALKNSLRSIESLKRRQDLTTSINLKIAGNSTVRNSAHMAKGVTSDTSTDRSRKSIVTTSWHI